MLRFVVLLLTLAEPVTSGIMGRTQSSGARGVLMCNNRPVGHVAVKLYDDGHGNGNDDLMGSTRADRFGQFQVTGFTSEPIPIDPKINIYHDCNDGYKPCKRKTPIKIPDSYITPGKTPQKIYDFGIIQLASEFPDETRDCFH